MSFPFIQMTIVLHPSRIRHNGDKGADVQQGPAQKFLFRLSPCVNLFYCLLLFNHPRGFIPTEDTAVIDISPLHIKERTWKHRVYNEWAFLSPSSIIKSEYLRECSASRVWPYMHQLRIMSLVKCWFARLLGLPPDVPLLSAKVAKGELLRFCPGYSG